MFDRQNIAKLIQVRRNGEYRGVKQLTSAFSLSYQPLIKHDELVKQGLHSHNVCWIWGKDKEPFENEFKINFIDFIIFYSNWKKLLKEFKNNQK